MTSHLYFEARNYARRILTYDYEPQENRSDATESRGRVVSLSDRSSAGECGQRVSLSDRFTGYSTKEEEFHYSDGICVDLTNNGKLVDVFVHTGDSGVRDLRTYLQAKRALRGVSKWEDDDSETEMYEIPDFREREDSEDNETEIIAPTISKNEEDFLALEDRCSEEEEEKDQVLEQAEWPKPQKAAPFERFDKQSDADSSDRMLEVDVGCQERPIIPPEDFKIDDEERRKREERQKRIEEEKALVLKKIMAIKEKKELSRKDSIPAKEKSGYYKARVVIDNSTTTQVDDMAPHDNSNSDFDSTLPSMIDIDLTHRCDMEEAIPSRSRSIPGTHSDSVVKAKLKSAVSNASHISLTQTAKLTIVQYHKRSSGETESEQRAKKIARNVSLNKVGPETHKGDLLGDLLGAMQGEMDTRHVIDVKAPVHDTMLIGSSDGDRMQGESDTREVITVTPQIPDPIPGSSDGDIIVVDMEMDSNSSPPHVTTPAPVVQQSPVLKSPEEIEAQEALESYYKCRLEFEEDWQATFQDGSQPLTPIDATQTPSLTDSNPAATVSMNLASVWDRLGGSPALMKSMSERPFKSIGAPPVTNISVPVGTPPFLSEWGSSSFQDNTDCLRLSNEQMNAKDQIPNKQLTSGHHRGEVSQDMLHQSRRQTKKDNAVQGSFSDEVRGRPYEGPPRDDTQVFDRARSSHHSKGRSGRPTERSPRKDKDSFHTPSSEAAPFSLYSPEYSPEDAQQDSYRLVRFETVTPLVPDVPVSAFPSKSRHRTKKVENHTKKPTSTTDSTEGGSSKRPTKPETKGKFHTRTLLMGRLVEPRYIPLEPLYKIKPFNSRGEPQMVPIDPRVKFYQKKKQSLQAEDDLYVDALL